MSNFAEIKRLREQALPIQPLADRNEESQKSATPSRKGQAKAREPRQKRSEDEPLPEAPEIEKAVLSGIFRHPETGFPAFARAAKKSFFNSSVNQELYELAGVYWETNEQLDMIGFTSHLSDCGRLEAVGGAFAVTNLFTENIPEGMIDYYVEILREKYVLRVIRKRCFDFAGRVRKDKVSDLLSEMSETLDYLKRTAGGPNGAERFTYSDLMAFDGKHDPKCLVGNRYLVLGGSSLWAAGSGYGKSALALQLAVYWACGQSCFGLRPVRPLKSLIIEAENDLGDMGEQLQGVIGGVSAIGDIDIEHSKGQIEKNVGIHRAIGKTGREFLELLDQLVAFDRPDIVWIDPLFAFAGCDLLDPEKTGYFLRNGLFPIAAKRSVALNVIHHIGKPVRDSSKSERAMADIDYQYLGFGTSEIQNSFRAVNIIVPVASSPGLFKMVLSKRGERAGAKDFEGQWSRSIYMKHSTEGICWLQAETPERPSGAVKYTVEDILDEMSIVNGMTAEQTREHMKKDCGMSPRTFYRLWKDLKKGEKIRVDSGGKWYRK